MLGMAQYFIDWIMHNILPFFLLITPIVFFHELGHFLVARACGVKIETFSIGFGPTIVGWNDRRGTRWKISWIPLGGYVKFFGDLNAVSMPDRSNLDGLTSDEMQGAFPLKPLYQRALIVAAGPAANFVLAIVLLTGFLLAFGGTVAAPIISKVLPDSAASAAGFHTGDIVVSVDNHSIANFDQIRDFVWDRAGETLSIQVTRQGRPILLHVTPRLSSISILGERQQVGLLGIDGPVSAQQWTHVSYGLFGALAEASRETWSIVVTTLDYIWRIVTGGASASNLNGPIGVAKISAEVAAVSILSLLRLAAFISVSIGLVNLFPIPVLDGGHLLYYGCEALLGRPLGPRAQDVGFRLGIAVMLGLMLLATWNDLVRLNLF
jgi:regulator of sigma E protease